MTNVETAAIPGTELNASRVGLGTWAIGGWMWGGSDERQSTRTIQAAVDQSITLINTAPVYGFGRSEEIVGKADVARRSSSPRRAASTGTTASRSAMRAVAGS